MQIGAKEATEATLLKHKTFNLLNARNSLQGGGLYKNIII